MRDAPRMRPHASPPQCAGGVRNASMPPVGVRCAAVRPIAVPGRRCAGGSEGLLTDCAPLRFALLMPSQVQNGAAARVDPAGKKHPKERDDGHALNAQALRTECLRRVQKDIVVDEDDDPWVSSFGMQHVRAAFAAAADPPLKDRVKSY